MAQTQRRSTGKASTEVKSNTSAKEKAGQNSGGGGYSGFQEKEYWQFSCLFAIALLIVFIFLLVATRSTGFQIRGDVGIIQEISKSSISLAAILLSLIGIFSYFDKDMIALWFRLALFLDSAVFLAISTRGYFALMTVNQESLQGWNSDWRIIFLAIILIAFWLFSSFTVYKRVMKGKFIQKMVKQTIFIFPFGILVIALFCYQPMIIGAYFLGGMMGLIGLLTLAILWPALRNQIVTSNPRDLPRDLWTNQN